MKKKVLITGASRGIGRAIACKFLQEGYEVYGTFFQNPSKMDELVQEYGKENIKNWGLMISKR